MGFPMSARKNINIFKKWVSVDRFCEAHGSVEVTTRASYEAHLDKRRAMI